MTHVIRRIGLNLSQCIHTPAGNLLGRMWYDGFIQNLLIKNEYSGFPNNGGHHTFHLKLSVQDLYAFLELVKDLYGKRQKDEVSVFLKVAQEKLDTHYGLVPMSCRLAETDPSHPANLVESLVAGTH